MKGFCAMMKDWKSATRRIQERTAEAEVLARIGRLVFDQDAVMRDAALQRASGEDFGFGRVPEDFERGIPLDDAAGEQQVRRVSRLIQVNGVVGDADIVAAEHEDAVGWAQLVADEHVVPEDLHES